MYYNRYELYGHIKEGLESGLRLHTPAKNKLQKNWEWTVDVILNHNSIQTGTFMN